MSLFPTLRSKRYLQRILLSVTLLTVILLLVTAFSIMYTSERTVLSVQQSANEKVLSQIRYNVAQMNEIVADTAQTLYQNNDVKILRYSKTDDELMYQRITALDTFVGTSSFLHSIFVYNGHMDRFYVGNGNIRAVKDPYEKKFRSLISDSRGTPKLRLIPVDLDDTGTGSRKVDFFSYILFDPSSTQGLDDALILNIKSAWLFDNLDLIAREDGERTGNAYLMDGTGQILNADSEQERGISELAERLRPALGSGQSSGYEVMRIGGTKEVISFMKAGVQDWTLVHTQPYAEVVSQVQRLRYTTALLTILFLALAVAVAVMISKRLYRPFEQLFSSVVSNAPGEMVRGESIRDEMAFLSGLYGNLVDRVKLADSSIAENRWILKRFTLRQLVQESGLRTPAQWEKEARENGLAIDASGGYTLCVARIDDAASLAQRGDPGEQRLFHYAISNISEEIISEAFSIEVVDLKPDHLVFLIQRRGEGSERLIAMLGEIQQIVKQYYRLTFSVAVSDTLEDSRELSSLYAKTLNQSVYKLFYGRGSIITAGMVAEHERAGDLTIPSDLERRLAEGIRSASREMLDASLDRFFELLRVMPYDNCLHALSYLSIVIKRTVSEVNGNKLKPISTDLYRLHSVVLEQETLDDTKDVFRQLLHELCASRQEERDADRNDFMIETIKEIVQANYKDLNLSLQSVSELLKMSSVYVGRLFKKAEGKSLADYINEVRLQQTMLLLEKGDFTINEIMEAAGFSNQSHFFRLFKKKFGTTPREYRMKKMLS